MSRARSVYVHVPFCVQRCGYCDFTLVAGRDDLIDPYLQALEIEIERCPEAGDVDTLFLGGGTPTHLSVAELQRLLKIVLSRFPLAEDAEFSVEANPADLTTDKVAALADAGTNRISLGVQSFDDGLLQVLERDHRAGDVVERVELLQQRIRNVSLDLIFGVPGQSVAQWEQSLEAAVALQPSHLSTYGLTFEKGTSFWTRRHKGDLQPVPEETEREMYAFAMDRLESSGFAQYEISSFARPGFACRHNQVYWSGLPFLGFGPGAAGFDGQRRIMNHRSVTTWMNRTLAGESAIGEVEELSRNDRARELLVLAIRRTQGLTRTWFESMAGIPLDGLCSATISALCRSGLLRDDGETIALTREGRFLADTVASRLLS